VEILGELKVHRSFYIRAIVWCVHRLQPASLPQERPEAKILLSILKDRIIAIGLVNLSGQLSIVKVQEMCHEPLGGVDYFPTGGQLHFEGISHGF
jgi:hypothetical protein